VPQSAVVPLLGTGLRFVQTDGAWRLDHWGTDRPELTVPTVLPEDRLRTFRTLRDAADWFRVNYGGEIAPTT